MAYKRLGDILISANLINQKQLEDALKVGQQTKKRLGEVLIDSGVISQQQLINVLKFQLGVDYVDLSKYSIAPNMASYVPKTLARKYSCVPVRLTGDTLYLAMVDPLNFVAIEEVKAASKKKVVPLISTSEATDRAIVMLYGNEGVTKAIDEMQKTMAIELPSVNEVTNVNDNSEQTAPAIRLVNSIMERAISENASDIHIEPRENGLTIRMRIDGFLHPMLEIPANLQSAVISRIKIMGNMDIAERRIPQDGRCSITIKQKEIDLRVSTLPTVYGEKIVIRFLEKSANLLSTNGIGLQGKHLIEYDNLLQNSNGVILITGPTGSGKSTTMYTMITQLNNERVNLVTLEDPIEYNINGINQVQINDKVGLTFAEGLRSILRQDPDIISIGEIRDKETAEIAMRAAITGHLVLSTIHTNSAMSTLDRLVDIGVEPYLITSGVKGIIAQRLIRKVCPHCKKEYRPSIDELNFMHISAAEAATMKFYKSNGCPECLHTGYKGRTGVFEILTLNNDFKQLYRNKATQEQLLKSAYNSGYCDMLQDVRRLVVSGITTIDEAYRILHTTD